MKILSGTPFYAKPSILKKWFARHNPYVIPPAEYYIKYGKQYGVNGMMAFCHMCHETGFLKYGGDVKREQYNFAGIGATGQGEPGESYATLAKGVEAHIQNLALYGGKRLPAEELISPRAKSLYDVYLGRSLTWEGLQGKWGMDENYWRKLGGIYDNLRAFIDTLDYADDDSDGLDIFGDGSVIATVAEPGLIRYSVESDTKPTDPVKPSINKKVMISIGHSERVNGAFGRNKAIREYDIARVYCLTLKSELENYGVECGLTDRIDDDLWSTGTDSKGYDVFVEGHLNAFDKREHYTAVLVHPSIDSGSSPSAKLASRVAVEIGKALNNPVFRGSPGYPLGVMATRLTVLRAAASVGTPIRILTEHEFIDDETDLAEVKADAIKAGKAAAKAIYEGIR